MNAAVAVDTLLGLIRTVRSKGGALWSDGGKLHYRAPKGALTPEEIQRLHLWKSQLIELLSKRGPESTTSELRSTAEKRRDRTRAPLSFSQLAHLSSFDVHGEQYEGRSLRVVWTAVRLQGSLEIALLRESLAQLLARHDALRTRIVGYPDAPIQEIRESGAHIELGGLDLTDLPERERELEAEKEIERFILEPVNIDGDALWGIRVLKLQPSEHILIVAMEHLVSDGTSVNILVRDLLTIYTQLSQARPPDLPHIAVQFADYATWQRDTESKWVEQHAPYWREHLGPPMQQSRFPEDTTPTTGAHQGWDAIPVRIDKQTKAELVKWSRLQQTTLVLTVFTAYAACVLRWCNAREHVIQYQFNGRMNPDLQHTIGYFASPLYFRPTITENATLLDLLSQLTRQYLHAHEHADFFYLATQLPRPGFTQSTIFNWSPLGSNIDLSILEGPHEETLTCSPLRIVDPVRKVLGFDQEPVFRLADTGDEVLGSMFFPLNRYSMNLMNRFTRNFMAFITTLLQHPTQCLKDVPLL